MSASLSLSIPDKPIPRVIDDTQLFTYVSPTTSQTFILLFNLEANRSTLWNGFIRKGLVWYPDKTEVICAGTQNRRRSLRQLTRLHVSCSLPPAPNYLASHSTVIFLSHHTYSGSTQPSHPSACDKNEEQHCAAQQLTRSLGSLVPSQ